MKYCMLTLILGFAFLGCETINTIGKEDQKTNPVKVTPETISGLKTGAVDIFRQSVASSPSDHNVIISPLGIQYAFAMAANGARGQTLDALMPLFGVPGEKLPEVNNHLTALMQSLAGSTTDYSLSVSNAVFYDPNKFSMSDGFRNTLSNSFKPDLEALDFDQTAQSLDHINKWVADHTNQRIPKVLNDIRQDEFMFLINALYMKASWDKPFAPEITHPATFTNTVGQSLAAYMMNQRSNIAYYRSETEQAILLPMSEGRLEAVFILPQNQTIDEYINRVSSADLDRILSGVKEQDLIIELPKIETLLHYDLKQILMAMGIVLPFSDNADFTRMGTASNNILLTRALHDVFMKMDEKGMEGAAVTTIGVGVTSMPESVVFNKPFMMAVIDKVTGAYLFLGKIEKV